MGLKCMNISLNNYKRVIPLGLITNSFHISLMPEASNVYRKYTAPIYFDTRGIVHWNPPIIS